MRSLEVRLAKLEGRTGRRREKPLVAFAVYDQTDDCVIGYGGLCGQKIERKTGEPLEALRQRVSGVLKSRIVVTLYRLLPVPVTITAVPQSSLALELDPFALAGVGRTASSEELQRMGYALRQQTAPKI